MLPLVVAGERSRDGDGGNDWPDQACVLPIAHIWGSGEVASADGIRFVTPSSAIHAGPNPKYFGAGRGITYYNIVSDQFTGLNAIVVPGTLRDSLLILGLLLEQETDLDPDVAPGFRTSR